VIAQSTEWVMLLIVASSRGRCGQAAKVDGDRECYAVGKIAEIRLVRVWMHA
jgi:hypothetical protein